MALVRVAGALQTFPLPTGSAQAEMVAAGVVKQTSLEVRKKIFLEFGAVSPPLAALVAELVGFDPSLVMPELARQQDKQRQDWDFLQQQEDEEAL